MIIGLTGRIAAGKGYLVGYLLEKGFNYATISKTIREEASKLGLPAERKIWQDLGNEMREKYGNDFWIKKIVSSLKSNENYIIDGIRNPGEIEALKKEKNFFLIALDSDQKIRFERVLKRDKVSDPKIFQEFVKIDERDFCEKDEKGDIIENGQQVGKCMEIADFHIENNSSLEELNKKIESIYQEIEKRLQ